LLKMPNLVLQHHSNLHKPGREYSAIQKRTSIEDGF
jgi:hypothetical protein